MYKYPNIEEIKFSSYFEPKETSGPIDPLKILKFLKKY